MVNINFTVPDSKNNFVIIGFHNGNLLSESYEFTSEETALLNLYSKKKRKDCNKSVVFYSFLKNNTKNKPCIVKIADIKKVDLSEIEAQEIGAEIFHSTNEFEENSVCIDFSKDFPSEILAQIAIGFKIRSFKFDKYKTKDKEKNESKRLQDAHFVSSNQEILESNFEKLRPMSDAVDLARSLSYEVPNILTPEMMAEEAKKLRKLGVKIDVLDEKDMQKLGMNALLGVAKGSTNKPYFVACYWNGASRDERPIALVGKGVTFDSGGISIKPSNNMHEMKTDMTGAAVVLSTMQMVANLNLSINIVGVVGLVENMPSGCAQRPSDVVFSMSGQTIEIQNTDAEGRLVLADALSYVQKYFKPNCIIDFATLTGAIQVALGKEFAGIFSNNDSLATSLVNAGEVVKERLWRLPLDPAFDKDIDSDIADMKNVGSGRGAGSITAAQFLQRFVKNNTPWCHIDIAAVSDDNKERPLTGVGITGFGVRLMYAFLNDVARKANCGGE